MAVDWRDYQEEAAEFFRSLGLKATTDASVPGVRTTHDIDVLVELEVAGFQAVWLVECKCWKTPVSKLHVLALREIVSDIGADRGIILCETGFQSGAVEAASLTNVRVGSLSSFAASSAEAVNSVRLRDLYDRTEVCREKYWDIPKDVRIEKGLRFDVGDAMALTAPMYSGARVVDAASQILAYAFRGIYPIELETLHRHIADSQFPARFESAGAVVAALEPIISDLETRLATI